MTDFNFEESIKEQFNKFWDIYPRRIGKGAARRKFNKALERDSLENIMDGLTQFKLTSCDTDTKYLPHAATWLHQDRWLDEIEPKHVIDNPHPDLDHYCAIINDKLLESQRGKGNWSKIKKITDGKQTINNWLHKTALDGWDKCVLIGKLMSAMQCGTVVDSFKHWEARLR